jgi:hypothetical protein
LNSFGAPVVNFDPINVATGDFNFDAAARYNVELNMATSGNMYHDMAIAEPNLVTAETSGAGTFMENNDIHFNTPRGNDGMLNQYVNVNSDFNATAQNNNAGLDVYAPNNVEPLQAGNARSNLNQTMTTDFNPDMDMNNQAGNQQFDMGTNGSLYINPDPNGLTQEEQGWIDSYREDAPFDYATWAV